MKEPETTRERRRRLAGIAVVLLVGIPAVYGVVMGIVEIVRRIIEDLH